MALIVEEGIRAGEVPRTGFTPFYLAVSKDKLSIPYQVRTPILKRPVSFVLGRLVAVKRAYGEPSPNEVEALAKIEGKELDFLLQVAVIGSHDFAFFSEKAWPVLRDAGITSIDYVVRVSLEKLRTNGRTVDIYPLRDVT